MPDPERERPRFSFDDAPLGWSTRSPDQPGWYYNAEHTYQAYWDGERWTGVTRPPPPPRPVRRTSRWLWLVVVILAVAVVLAITARVAP